MANEQLQQAEAEFRDILNDTLAQLKVTGGKAAAQIIDEYAPRFAALATKTGQEAQDEYDDLMVNLDLDENINAVEAQAAGVGAVMNALRIIGRVARSMVLPALA